MSRQTPSPEHCRAEIVSVPQATDFHLPKKFAYMVTGNGS